MIDPSGAQCLPQRLGDVFLALDLGKGRWPVAAVERQRSVRNSGSRRVCGASGLTGAGDVACHNLFLAGEGRTPRTPARARIPLLPSGPGGVDGINAVRGVWR